MAARIISVAQQKGGAGKTTLAVHLAVALAGRQRRVAILDTDKQASLTQWWELRGTLLGHEDASLQHFAADGSAVAEAAIDRLRRDFDVVVIDSPPHTETEARTIIRAADLVVVPLQPSALDLWATRATLELAKAEARRTVLVLNRVPPRSALAVEMIAGAAGFGAAIAEAQLGNRVGFAAAMALGQAVTETQPGSAAAREARAVAREIGLMLDQKKPRAR